LKYQTYTSFTKTLLILGLISSSILFLSCNANTNNISFSNGTIKGFLIKNNPLDEASGLAASTINQNILWTHEDDWNPYIFAMNDNGAIKGKYQIDIEGTDVEDIAIGPGPKKQTDYLYIAHIGDNNAARSTIFIRRVPEPIIEEKQTYTEFNLTDFETITLQYPDGPKDAETIMIDTNADIYIVTKRLTENKIYRASYPQTTEDIIILELIATLPDRPEYHWITAGDISTNGEWIILRNDQSDDYAFLWHRNHTASIEKTLANEPLMIDLYDEPQGEAICFNADTNGFYTVSEHAGYDRAPIWFYQFEYLKTANQHNNSALSMLLILCVIVVIIIFIFNAYKKSTVINLALCGILILCIGFYATLFVYEQNAVTINSIQNAPLESEEPLLTISFHSTEYDYSSDELISSFKSISGFGTKINQIGAISGPEWYTGIPVMYLIQSIDKLPNNYYVLASAKDYTYNFSKEHVQGHIECVNENGESDGLAAMTMIVAYKINNETLNKSEGGPLRIGFIDSNGSITHSNLWVRSIHSLKIYELKEPQLNPENLPPTITIDVSSTNGNAPLTVYFNGTATDPDGTISSYEWDFGNGIIDTKKNTHHIFKKVGSYEVTFSATDNNNTKSVKTIQVNVSYLTQDGCVSPTDFYDPNNDWMCPENAFDDNIHTFARCTKTGFWQWTWTGYLELFPPLDLYCNKIRIKAWYNPKWCDTIDIDLFFNETWNTIYEGSYKNKEWEIIPFPLNIISKARVRFHLRQAYLGIDADLYEFDFYYEINNTSPVPDFSFHPMNANRNQTIYFTDESVDSDGIIVNWQWDFGDGSTSNLRNPSHKYLNIGYYEVALTVRDNNGGSDFISKQITIGNQIPIADFRYTPLNPTIENSIYFTDMSTDTDGGIIHWLWDFGDGHASNEQHPQHQYTIAGTYQVLLVVTDTDGGIAEINKIIVINNALKNWNVTLSGKSQMVVSRQQFETWVSAYETCWSDGNHTWCGVPLWIIIAMIDDVVPEDHVFNNSYAASGYTIRLTAGDSWVTDLSSTDIAYTDGYLIVNTIDGEALPEYTPKGRPSWPIHLRGSDIHPPNNVGNIVSIEIIPN